VSQEKLATNSNRNMIVGYIIGMEDDGGASHPEIARKLGLSENTANHHLEILLENRIITCERKGNNGSRIFYFPNRRH